MERSRNGNDAMQDYSVKIVQLNNAADGTLLGVQLGRVCIQNNIPVASVAAALNVSKSVVYKWFTGRGEVGKHLRDKVEAYYRSIPPAAAPATPQTPDA